MIPTHTGYNGKQEEMLRIDSSQRMATVDLTSVDYTCSYNGTVGPCRAIYVGGAGNLVIKNSLGDNITFSNVSAGALYPYSTTTIVRTGTTATNLIAHY